MSMDKAFPLPASAMSPSTPSQNDPILGDIRRHLRLTLALVGVLVVGLGGWMVFAKVSGAVISSGTVVVESSTKEVQHQEGGIVSEILVRDGDMVRAGDPILRLDDTVTRANLAVVTKQLAELTATEARLVAERDGLDTIAFVDSNRGEIPPTTIEQGQVDMMAARRSSREGRKAQLSDQIVQLERQIEGLEAQRVAKSREIDLVDQELADLSTLVQKQLVQRSRITSLRRERTRLEGERGDLVARIAEAHGTIGERRLQILQVDEDFRAETLETLQETRAEIARLEEQGIAARDKLTRVVIQAPRSGYVHQLAAHTIGGVISPGETVMKIVPMEDQLVIETKVQPKDIDQLTPDQVAEVQFPSFDQRNTPKLAARLLTVSPDLTVDERTEEMYYTARLGIDDGELEKLDGKHLVPGMPAEVFIKTGDRTVLSYLIKPLVDQLAHALRE